MTQHEVVRAWKDPVFRTGLAADELAALPDPVAWRPIGDDELAEAYGLSSGYVVTTFPTCTMTTWKKGCCP